MAAVKLTTFSGLRPRLPESLLPEGAATIAQNCDLAYGELRNTKGGYLVNTMSNFPKSLFTDDGLTFYSWTTDVNAVRSPLGNDLFDRVYYTGDGGFKVADRLATRLNGGPPSSSYLVGVPRPSAKPVLLVKTPVEATTANATFVFKFHYELSGVKYQEDAAFTVTTLNNKQFQFTPPTKAVAAAASGSTPEIKATPTDAIPVLRVIATSIADKSQLFDIYTENSALTSSGGYYSLAISKDATGTAYTTTLTTGIKESDKETRAYIYTYANIYNEEGPPSDPTLVTTSPVTPVDVTVTKDNIPAHAPIKEIRVYRTASGSSIADYFYAGSISVLSVTGTVTYTDNRLASLLNEPLSSASYYPPDQGLVGLMTLPNGILCGWVGNRLCFSEAYKPWAWPPQYVKPLPHAIVGGMPHGAGAIITTTTSPYLLSGVSPDSMTASRINADQAGVSKWSMAVVNGSAIYASHDGLVTLNGGTASLTAGQQFFTREKWRELYGAGLSGMRFSVWDGRLVVFHDTGAFTPFMVQFDEANAALTDLPNFVAQCGFVSPLSDQFYYAQGFGVFQFNGGNDITATWQSREAVIAKPTNYGFAQALVTGSWIFELWAYDKNPQTGVFEYQLKHSQSLTAGRTDFRLRGGYTSDRYRIKITGIGHFRELRMANTARELATI